MTLLTIFKVILILLLFFMIFNLGKALFILIKGEKNVSMSHYLGKRVLFSATVIILLIIMMGSGIIAPNPRPY